MPVKSFSWIKAAFRYVSYPLVMGATALMVFGGLAEGWPYVPTVAVNVGVALAVVSMLESRLPFHVAWLRGHRDTACDVLHAVVNLSVLLAVHAAIASLTLLWPGPMLWPEQWPLWAQAVLVGVVLDLSLYTVHRVSHQVPWLWRFHAIHHSSERLYWLNGERRHPLHAGIMAGPGLITVVLLGAPALAVGAWLGVLAVHLAFQHSNLDYRLGPFRYLIGAAEVHRWHHKRAYEDAQINFGEFWMVWDHVFGTFRLPQHALGATEVGLNEADFPMDYGRQLVYPFTRTQLGAAATDTSGFLRAESAFQCEKALAAESESAGILAAAWRAHELGHIVAQPYLGLHLCSHAGMLRLAWRSRNPTELLAQLVRLALVPIGHILRRTPPLNVGTSRFRVMERGTWPTELDPLNLERR